MQDPYQPPLPLTHTQAGTHTRTHTPLTNHPTRERQRDRAMHTTTIQVMQEAAGSENNEKVEQCLDKIDQEINSLQTVSSAAAQVSS